MNDWLARLDSSDLTLIVFMLLAAIVIIVTILASVWYYHRKVQVEAQLKHEMVRQGMSGSEIERAIRATTGGETSTEADAEDEES